jgi:hypothetical protein
MRARLSMPALAALLGCLALAVPSALAVSKLTIPKARERSERFARRTCAHDGHCVRHGVLNCRRQGPRTVLCRIFDERATGAQGRYRCNRLIRVTLDPPSGRRPVTGIGRWHC